MNRLRDATSPYLLQHAENPVEWYPWGEDAFAQARRRDVPVLLSVGYAACHWCHVMAHESFEDQPTADLMNAHFVNIKVDREERPDVDAVYMEATQALVGQGGWPMTVFMTPEGHPFYCGTYFPRQHFQTLLQGVSRAWTEQRDDVVQQGQQVVTALISRGGLLAAEPAAGARGVDSELLGGASDQAVAVLRQTYDTQHGGFGGAPKFPPSMVLEFLLRRHARTGDRAALDIAVHTLEVMARGGMYDQLGGGFARYSVDERWVVPHFEKMLYDNALLARAYAHWWRLTGAPLGRRIALETCEWMLRDLRTPEGGLASALDADSEGEEGKYYVWTPEQLRTVLGAKDGARAATLFAVTDPGTFEHGTSVLQLRRDPCELAAELVGVDCGGDAIDEQTRAAAWEEATATYERIRTALLAARTERVPPARDDKVVAAWNGLAIAALAECGALLGRPDLVEAAVEVARLVERVHLSADSRLLRTSRDGVAGPHAGVLEDYADVAEGLIALHAVTGDPHWIAVAGRLLDTVLAHFGDAAGGFFDTADDAEALFRRPKDPTDNAAPSGQFAAAGALLSHAALTGSTRHREAATAALAPVAVLAGRHARFAGWGLAVTEAALAGPLEVAVVGELGDERTQALHRTALLGTSPGAVVTVGPGTGAGAGTAAELDEAAAVPLLAGRGLVDGAPAAYVCRDFTCQLPVTQPADLAAELAAATGSA